jgi:hypothetical protein
MLASLGTWQVWVGPQESWHYIRWLVRARPSCSLCVFVEFSYFLGLAPVGCHHVEHLKGRVPELKEARLLKYPLPAWWPRHMRPLNTASVGHTYEVYHLRLEGKEGQCPETRAQLSDGLLLC